MKLNEFIFSKNRKIRIFRHITAWLLLYLFAIITYPPKGSGTFYGLGADGFFNFYRMVAIRTFLMVVCQMFFAYFLLYLLIPFYFRKKKYFLFVCLTLVLFLITAAFRYVLYTFVYNPVMVHFHYHINNPNLVLLFSIRQTVSGPAFLGGLFIFLKLYKDQQQKQKDFFALQKENINAEIQLFKAQVHPHFLFNTLNNIYAFTLNHSPIAGELVQKLYGMMYYMMYECNDPLVSLEKEIQILKNYSDLEKVRYGSRLDFTMDISGNSDDKKIAPLLMIPFLENCFKHGTSQTLINPWIKLNIRISENRLFFTLVNSQPTEKKPQTAKKGIGLTNIKKRLGLIYGQSYILTLENNPENYLVNMEVPIQKRET